MRSRSLADLDPDLFLGLGPRELARVGEIAVPVVDLDAGPWVLHHITPDAGLGLLVLDGMLIRTVALGDEAATELLGAGDLIRPWETVGDAGAIVPCAVGWNVLMPTRLAVLGRQLAAAAADCPGLVAALIERSGRRARSQGIVTAVAHMKRIDARVLVLLWHVAERWGRVTSDGVVIPVRLTHQRLAQLVGAQRPSVTAALSRMAERGMVRRTPNRGYLLTDSARDHLEALCRGGEPAAPPIRAVA